MKYLVAFILILSLTACGKDREIPPGSTQETPSSIDTIGEKPAVANPTPPVAPVVEDPKLEKAPAQEIAQERIEQSEVAMIDCCQEEKQPNQCCCDKVLQTFEEKLKKEGVDAASEFMEDGYYDLCNDRLEGFEAASNAIIAKYLQ